MLSGTLRLNRLVCINQGYGRLLFTASARTMVKLTLLSPFFQAGNFSSNSFGLAYSKRIGCQQPSGS